MKSILIFLSFNLLFNQLVAQDDTTHVLFIGNSYTGVNSLPTLFQQCAASAGRNTFVSYNNPGGYSFQMHCTNATTQTLIQQGGWDFVVLQEQSQMPSFPIDQVITDCFPYARQLNDSVVKYSPCGETVFYQTWGRQNGDASNCPNWPPVCTYAGMDSLLQLRYGMMADTNRAIVSPVGACWRYIRTQYPDVVLYNADQSHPSLMGSYVAALSFYVSLFRESSASVTYNPGLTDLEMSIAHEAADNVIVDHWLDWNIGQFDYHPMITLDTIGMSVSANFECLDCDSVRWSVGDGNVYNTTELFHQYSQPGLYGVTLVVYRCGKYYSQYWEVLIQLPNTILNQKQISKFHRISESQIAVTGQGNGTLELGLFNVQGQLIERYSSLYSNEHQIVVDLKNNGRGMYFLKTNRVNDPIFRFIY
jgi:hypothetical protein